MKRLLKFIHKNSSGKKVLGLFILTNAVYVFMLTVTIPMTMEFSSGMKLLDMMPLGYDLDYVDKLFETLGEGGRGKYLTSQIPVDMFYPLLFGLSYSLLFGYFLKKLNMYNAPYFYLCFLPIIVMIFDYLENIGIIIMLKTYPQLTPNLVDTISVFSTLKSVLASVVFICLVIILTILLVRLARTKK